ncbi:hypothetical protein GCM10027176_62850 [Actinoallomurus bryophytorum]|uniref:Uncharacterized protein n=1 Tax=Actinoallomurus bryophytorum TaxID=1490222 RepID=A0A543CFB8_9ACTN|nr:hypothetical protein [Actinoallomurus bryophytorum]TQL95789.1 hypothetical protein FB559_1299 [Actinoallomurus bryophytorum]
MVRNTTRSLALSKVAAIVAGLGVAVGLAVAAPVRAASPSTAASRIVQARHDKAAGHRSPLHRLARYRSR